MIDQKIYFVCYHAGAGGQFIGALTEILLTGTTLGQILPNGEVDGHSKRNFITNFSLIFEPYYNILSGNLDFVDGQKKLFNQLVNKIIFHSTQNFYVIPTHLFCINELLSTFTNSMVITVYPSNPNEIIRCREIWINKNRQWHSNLAAHSPELINQIYESAKKLHTVNSPKVLHINFSDVHNHNGTQPTILKIDDFVGGNKKYIEPAIEFYKEYLKNQ
jgi:hypothetical protein